MLKCEQHLHKRIRQTHHADYERVHGNADTHNPCVETKERGILGEAPCNQPIPNYPEEVAV